MPTVREYAALFNCSTAGLKGLNDQVLELLQNAVGDQLVSCSDIVNVVGSSTIPYLQPGARDALAGAVEERGTDLNLIHAYRTVAQQYVLRFWRDNGKCDITQAATPGSSNHERGVAIDIDGDQVEAWKATLGEFNWEWFGPGDRGHFTYKGDGADHDILTESVLAFQRLWNKNNPDDPIEEDGDYGPETKKRLQKSPVDGWS